MEYIYAGKVPVLIRKKIYGKKIRVSGRFSYYSYKPCGGMLFPWNIVYENHQRGYRLIIRTRAVYRDGVKP